MRKHDVIKRIKFFASIVSVFILGVFVYKTSYALLTNSIIDKIGFDEETSKYITFNYSANAKTTFEIKNPKILSDFRGKNLLSNNYYDFEVSLPSTYNLENEAYYEIILSDMSNSIDSSFIKVYLTDQNNKELDGFDNFVPVLSVFPDADEGKIIYTGKFSKNNLLDKYRIRIWISSDVDKKIDGVLAYQLQVRAK